MDLIVVIHGMMIMHHLVINSLMTLDNMLIMITMDTVITHQISFGGDACKFDYGTSYLDRLGCHDSDGDGASDPTTFWNASMGADIWPDDPTQWADSDGDGYGDNSSQNAT